MPASRWTDVMRGAAILIAYLLGLGAIISFGIAGLMALQRTTPPASVTAAAPHQPANQTTQKLAPSQKRKPVQGKRREEVPNPSLSGLDAYGYANEPRLRERRRLTRPWQWGLRPF